MNSIEVNPLVKLAFETIEGIDKIGFLENLAISCPANLILMKPGKDLLVKCPKCNGFLKKQSIISGNTFGAKLYSDGKRVATMLPDYPNITRCPICRGIFWVTDAKVIDPVELESNEANQDKAPQVEFLKISDYSEALSMQANSDLAKQKILRKALWWKYNDRSRKREALFRTIEEEKLYSDNLSELIGMLNRHDISESIMIAEAYRNLGMFEQCKEALNIIADSNLNWVKNKLKSYCEDGIKETILLD